MNLLKTFKNNIWSIALLLAILIEILLHTTHLNFAGIYISQIFIVLVGLLICVFSYQLGLQNQDFQNQVQLKRSPSSYYIVYGILFFSLFIYIFNFYSNSIKEFPNYGEYSDIIPTLERYNKRLLNNEDVYAIMPYVGYSVVPNYLTLQWLPYIIAELFKIDYRIYSFVFFIISTFLFLYSEIKTNGSLFSNLLKISMPFFLIYMIIKTDSSVFGITSELVVCAYYSFLAMSLYSKKWWVIALAISFCLLSRFSFIYWLPFLSIYLFTEFKFQKSMYIFLFVFMMGILVYVLPFMTKDPTIFLRGIKYYVECGPNEWTVQGWQNPTEKPYHLQRGLGFSIYFYDFWNGLLNAKIAASRNTQLFFSLLVSLTSLIILFKSKIKISKPLFALLSLKIYMIAFYQLIQVPYLYLQLVPLCISLIILYKSPLFSSKFKTDNSKTID